MKIIPLFALAITACLWMGCGQTNAEEETRLQEEILDLESMASSLDSTAATIDMEVDSLENALLELEELFSDQENK